MKNKYNKQDLQSFPPDIDMAIKHGKASRVGRKIDSSENNICQCCGYEIDLQPVQICQDHIDLLHFGIGYPLFFQYIKWCCVFMFMGILIFQIFGMINNSYGSTDCVDINPTYVYLNNACNQFPQSYISVDECNQQNQSDLAKICQFNYGLDNKNMTECCIKFCNYREQVCFKSWTNQFNFPNIQFQINKRITQSCMVLLFVILTIVMLQYMLYNSRVYKEEINEDRIDSDSFTIMIRGLPQGQYTEQELGQFIQQQFSLLEFPDECIIVQICIAYNIFEYTQLGKKQQKILLQRNKIDYYRKKYNKYPKKWNEQLYQNLKTEIDQTLDQINQMSFQIDKNSAQASEISFVSFLNPRMAEFLLYRVGNTSFFKRMMQKILYCLGLYQRIMVFKGRPLYIERAPDPTDVIWKNCGFTEKQKQKQRTLYNIIILIVLTIVFLIQVSIQISQAILLIDIQNKVKTNYQFLISFGYSIVVIAFNTGLRILIFKLIKQQKYSTYTHFNINLTESLLLTNFLNSAVLTFVSTIFVSYFYSNYNKYYQQIAIQQFGAVADEVLLIALSNLASQMLNIIDPNYYFKLFKRWLLTISQDSQLTQLEANRLFEGKYLQIYEKYSNFLLSIYFTAIYGSLVPSLFIISALGFILNYWIEKVYHKQMFLNNQYNFSKRYSKLPGIGSRLNEEMITLLECFPLLFAVGQLILDYIYGPIDYKLFVIDLLSVSIGGAYILIPSVYINRRFFPRVKVDEMVIQNGYINYNNVKTDFSSNYIDLNPLHHDIYLAQLFKHNQKTDQNIELQTKQTFSSDLTTFRLQNSIL